MFSLSLSRLSRKVISYNDFCARFNAFAEERRLLDLAAAENRFESLDPTTDDVQMDPRKISVDIGQLKDYLGIMCAFLLHLYKPLLINIF